MRVLSFGEILFDCYPTAQKIGGAPFNFSAHLAQLGGTAFLYSAVGKDALGETALFITRDMGVDTRYTTPLSHLPTGICKITYQGTEPSYDLSGISAFDEIPILPEVCSQPFDLFYFGTLASRSDISRSTLEVLLSYGNWKRVFFDMNLRQSYYSKDLVRSGLFVSDLVKMNREEFSYVKEISGISDTNRQTALQTICSHYGIKTAILTLDKEGACVWDQEQGLFTAPAKESKFVSAVGAGDSFCACFLYHLFQGASIPDALEKASILSAYVISCEEAVPSYSERLKDMLH